MTLEGIKSAIEANHKSVVDGIGGIKSEVGELKGRMDDFETKMNRERVRPGDRQDGPEVKAFDVLLRKGDDAEYVKAMSVGSDGDGGYAVPEQIDSQVQSVLQDVSAMRRLALVKKVRTANYKKLMNTHGTGSGWVGETDARTETGTPSLEALEPPQGEIYANPAITQTLLDDAFFDVGDWLTQEIMDAFAAKEGTAFISGTGTKMPKGLLAYTSSTDADDARTFGVLRHMETDSATAFTPDELIDLVFDLKAGYRANAAWMMNSATAAMIRKFKDSNGDYIWKDGGMKDGFSGLLFGYPVALDENMPDVAAEAVPVVFGDFRRGYLIVDRVTRLLRDPYSNKPYVNFYATKRVSGMLTDSNAIRLLKMAASA
jgi:HK97 family phage major capsid protein